MTTSDLVRIRYTNYRGETSWRTIIPVGIRFAATTHHPKPQWILDAFDIDKQAERAFAMADILLWEAPR